MESFTDYPDEELRNQVYEKIERNVDLTIWEVNMNYYRRLLLSLLDAGRHKSPLWDKIEQHVIKNLGMDYSVRTFCDIFKAFALSHNGTEEFYEICQHVIYKGHLDSSYYRLRNNLSEFDATGEYFALLVETYGIVHQYSSLKLSPELQDYIYKSLKHSKVEFSEISSLSRILRYLPHLDFERREQEAIVGDIIRNKRFKSFNSVDEIGELYVCLEEFNGHIPQKVQENIEALVTLEIQRKTLPLLKAVQITQYLVEKHTTSSKREMLLTTQEYLDHNFKYLDNEDAHTLTDYMMSLPVVEEQQSGRLMLPNFKNQR